ncbi:MAG TPA: Ig-like domain repeat protein [Bryobacteraceae bacterium]
MNVTFSPTHPGPRLGAVKILDGSGNLLATQYVTAIGVSPQVIFSPGIQSALGGGFSQPYGVATDSSGNVYVADQANNAVKKIPSGCATSSCVVTLGGGFSAPYGVAVDGAGNVLVADNGNNALKEIPVDCTSSTCVISVVPVGGPAGIAVDGDGNIYVTDSGDGIVIEVPQGCMAQGCTITLGGGWNNPHGLATDGNGNLFVADEGNAAVKELAITCLTSSCVSEVGGGISQPYSVAVDASGNVFVGDQGSTAIRKIPSGCTSSSCVSTLSGSFAQPFGVALDGSGNLFVGNASATTVAKLDFADPPSLTYASLHVGATGAPQAVTASNDGNAALSFTASGLTSPTDFSQVSGSGTPPDCADSGTVAAGVSCNLSIEFSPLSTGAHAEAFVLTDNDLNISAATQSISITGTALAADATAVAVGVNPSPPGVGQAVTVTATVSDTTNSGTTPTGSVTFSDSVDGSLNGGEAVTLASGVASLTGVVLSGSSGTAHTITASYQGVVNLFVASSNSTTIHMASFMATSTVLAAAPSGSVAAGAAVTLTATVSPAPTGSSLGTASFYDGETLLGSGNVNSSGVATLTLTTLSVGAHSLTAVYSGNTGFAASTSSAITETVTSITATATITVLTGAPSPVDAGQSVTFTAAVSPTPTGSATGTVSFYNGSTLLGTETLSSGAATFTTSSLPAGVLSITAVYSGDTELAGSTSAVLMETVSTAYTVTAPPTPVPVAQGGSVEVSVNVPPLGGAFNNLVTLSASGLPPGATATFNPPAVTPGSAGAPTVMTIQLATATARLLPGSGPGSSPTPRQWPLAGLVLTIALGAAGWRTKSFAARSFSIRSGSISARRMMARLVLAGALGTLIGCGGGFIGPPTTQPGSFVVTITGTSGSLSVSTTVTVVVQ